MTDGDAPLIARAPCPADAPLRLGVLASGSGSNLQALLDASHGDDASYRVVVVGSNKPGAYALERAKAAEVATFVHNHREFDSREAFDAAMAESLRAHDVELVVLAGFMRVLTPALLDAFKHRVVNVHPALCPAFPGMHAPRQALEHGARITGCTVHLVDAGVDTGPILAQAAVAVLDDDDEASLTARIQAQEHQLFSRVIAAVAAGEVRVSADGGVKLKGRSPSGTALQSAS